MQGNNPVESINSQSIPPNIKSVSLKPLVEHIYLEDRRHACLEVTTNKGVTISYIEQQSHLGMPDMQERHHAQPCYLEERKQLGYRLASVEYYSNESRSSTTWYKGQSYYIPVKVM